MNSRLVTGDVRERPILFSGEMVRALLSGAKTQTRRAMKPQPKGSVIFDGCWLDSGYGEAGDTAIRCPYGKVGDRLWVKETWQHEGDPHSFQARNIVFYRADYLDDPHGPDGENSSDGRYRFWRPSIHMPRAASRITLEITDVRVERLQAISEADAIAEGIERHAKEPTLWKRGPLSTDQNNIDCTAFPRLAYRSIWESINGPGSWESNPFVWAISFNRIKEPK